MSETLDWFPDTREGQLAKAKAWVQVLLSGNPPPFGVPQTEANSFAALTTQAGNTLDMAKSGDRTPVITAQCRDDFGKPSGGHSLRRWR
jgi:hypothetical protein